MLLWCQRAELTLSARVPQGRGPPAQLSVLEQAGVELESQPVVPLPNWYSPQGS